MAEFPIDVRINPDGAIRGSRRVRSELERISNSAQRVQRNVDRAFQFVGLGIGIDQLVTLTDTFTNLQNRIRTVTDSTAELNVVTAELFSIAQNTRIAFQNTAELYTRTALATRDLGISQRETIQFTESLSQAVQLSGASATEANNALIQLSQGLASGVLRGDELRSVLEQLPVVADIIAEELGATRGELRGLGTDGRITSDIIIDAFRNVREELTERFAELTPTITQGFTVLRNAIIELNGEFNNTSGLSAIIGQALIDLAENLDTVVTVAEGLVITLGISLARTAIPAAISAFQRLSIAILANPFAALAAGAALAIGQLIAFSDQITIAQDSTVTLAEFSEATGERIRASFEGLGDIIEENFSGLAEQAEQAFQDISVSFEGFFRLTARIIDGIIGFWSGLFNEIVDLFTVRLPSAIDRGITEALNFVLANVEATLNGVAQGINAVFDFAGLDQQFEEFNFTRFQTSFEGDAEVLGRAFGSSFMDGLEFSGAQNALDSILARSEEIASANRAQAAAEQVGTGVDLDAVAPVDTTRIGADLREVIESLREQQMLLQLNTREREIQSAIISTQDTLNRQLTETETQLLDTELRYVQALTTRSQIVDELREPQQALVATQEQLNILLQQGIITGEEYGRVLRDAQLNALQGSTDFASGFERGFLRLQQAAGDFSTISETAITGAFNGATDAIIEFVTTGETNFRSFAASILQQIARIALQQAILGAFGSVFGGPAGVAGSVAAGAAGAAAGAGTTGVQNAGAFQTGGQFTVGGSGGIDSQMVQFRATPGERVTVETSQQQRDQRRGGAGVQGGGVNNTIVNLLDPNLLQDYQNTPEGGRSTVNVIRRNATPINQAIGDAF